MIASKIEIQIDEKAIQEKFEQKIEDTLAAQIWFCDVERLSLLTGMSKRFLEENILNHPYMKSIERKKSRKRFYKASDALNVIDEITREW